MNVVDHFKEMFDRLRVFSDEDLLCNIKLKSENVVFPAHKALLAAASDYFKILFTSEMEEKSQDVIEIRDVSAVALKLSIEYIYSGEVVISFENLKEILHSACLFQIWRLKEICVVFMKSNISAENCLGFHKLAQVYDCNEFAKKSKWFVDCNIKNILEDSEEFTSVDVEWVKEFLALENETLSDEVTLFQAVVKWIEFDVESRSTYVCELISMVRLPVMTKYYLCSNVLRNPWVSDCAVCYEYCVESMNFQMIKKSVKLNKQQMTKRGTEMIIFNQNKLSVYAYNLSSDNFTSKYSIENRVGSSILCCSLCFIDNKLFAIGGQNTSSVFSYNMDTLGWFKRAPLPKCLSDTSKVNGYAVISSGGFIYAMGGYSH